jgi:hypothetical protein
MIARPLMHRSDSSVGPPRRGVLLLVVLSMLTLFLMLGAAYIVSATRAKEAARAHARLTFGGDEARVPHARIADTVLLKVLRGGTASLPVSPAAVVFESLLADKYGQETISGSMTVSGAGPVMSGTVLLFSPFNSVRAVDLNGRLLTFVTPGRPVTTHRILRSNIVGGQANSNVTNARFNLSLDVPWRPGTRAQPLAGRVIINGREFAGMPPANEGWDGFDDDNPFLAQVGPGATIASSTVSRISFHPGLVEAALSGTLQSSSNSIPNGADNDNDGVLDGLFMDFGIPDVTDAHGNVVNIRASVLVVDLDGRFNVNAHGSLTPLVYSGTHPGWSSHSAVSGALDSAPMGSGYGPAEIAANLGSGNEPRSGSNVREASPRLFDSDSIKDTGNVRSSENPKLFLISGVRNRDSDQQVPRLRGERPSQSRFTSTEPTPRLRPLEGRYGWQSPVNPPNDPGSEFPDGWLSGTQTLSQATKFPWARPGQQLTDDAASRINDRRAAATAGDQVNYGIPRLWWTGTTFDWGTAAATRPLPRGVYNSPPDLHGRMKTLTLAATGQAIVPQVAFAQPEWSGTGASQFRETTDDPYEVRLDTRQGFGGWLHDPMTDGLSDGVFNHNPFTPGELEPVLRPYDIDTNRLPPRLAAILGSAAEESRLKVTTDSWDTTAITGSAAVVLFGTASGNLSPTTSRGWLQNLVSSALYGTTASGTGAIGGEMSRGEKFDLNRPLVASSSANAGYTATSEYVVQRQAYFKDLYTLLYALTQRSGTNALSVSGTLAQWAANVVEFRDADSRVIPFEYDTDPRNGWGPNGDVNSNEGGDRQVVWGAERPEIVIREAFAWRNTLTGSAGMAIALHRPWNAKAYATGSTNLIDAEPCDLALDTLSSGSNGRPTNEIDLGKKGNAAVLASGSFSGSVYNDVTGTTYPIWRLRLTAGGSTAYARLDSGSAAANEFVLAPAITNGAGKPKLAPDSTLSLVSGTLVLSGSGETSGTSRLDVSSSSRTVANLRMPGTAMSGTVYLERLSDLSVAPTAAQWTADPAAVSATGTVCYLVVDQTPITVVNTGTTTPPVAATSRKRATADSAQAFWRPPAADSLGEVQNNATLTFPSSLAAGSTAWLPWPNRPFTSAAELLLVPQGTAVQILENYRRLTPAESGTTGLGKGAPVPLALLFDAVHVPTRFAGIHTTGTANLSAHGIHAATVTANQLSSWREPGRVNLNTVVAEDVWNAVVAGPLTTAVRSSTNAALRGTPAETVGHLLALSGGGGSNPLPAGDTDPNLPADRNPLHGIYTATRLANTVTPRSNVFAIWITIRESVAGDPDSVRYRRAFYVVDRSIPVGFEDGVDHNVWDCVRLRRIIE